MKIYRYSFKMFSNKVVKCDEGEFDYFESSDSLWFYIYNSNKFIHVYDGIYFLSFTKISDCKLKR